MKALLTDMIHLDNSITVESCHNKELSFNNITNYPRNEKPSFHKTEAFEVECEPKNATTLIKLLCLADLPLRQFGTFIPFSIVREDPELLIQKMEDNNKYRNIMTNMYLNGWHPS